MLVRGGATLEDIGVLLRHSSRDSTAIYAKVDLPTLSLIAQPWPEPSP
jgi:site-specific recombinase XerD